MYICLCNGLTDRDLRQHMGGAGRSVSMVYRSCGCQPQCGKCVPFVVRMLREGAESPTALRGEGGAD
jgi:bacterioferritin-associated ferredoxin